MRNKRVIALLFSSLFMGLSNFSQATNDCHDSFVLEKEAERNTVSIAGQKAGGQRKAFMGYKEARQIVRELGISTVIQLREWVQSDNKPSHFPSHPERAYKSEWRGFGEFLGTGRKAGGIKKKFNKFMKE
ncbi:MAG: hypothetical protein OXN83_02740 [Oligoflexia bacterium]|nr:hypothetical protein [Oligoflexia bacterium]